MAANYLILLSEDPAILPGLIARASRTGSLGVVFATDRVAVMADAACPTISLGSDRGIVLGRLFGRSDYAPITSVDPPCTSPDASCLPVLIERCWGSYVAIEQGADRETAVLRDPSGGLPAYYVSSNGVHAIASDVATIGVVDLLRVEVDWENIGFQFRFPNQRSESTAIRGVRELLPGFALIWDGAMLQTEARWSPWDHVANRMVSDPVGTANRVRTTIEGCIGALGRSYGNMLAGVSGGLDSSIIAAALARAGCEPHCVTVATQHPEGDERHYARQLCSALKLPLHEAQFATAHVDPCRPSAPFLPRPIGEPFLQSYDHIARAIGDAQATGTIFRGNGGDAVFCFMQNATPIVDRLMLEGLRPALWKTVRDVCRMTESSLATVLFSALRKAMAGPTSSANRQDERFLLPAAGTGSAHAGHPWLVPRSGVPPGRATHVQWVVRVQRFAEGNRHQADLELICPLLSQPIIEECLAIPSWAWVAGGINRSAARSAFAGVLPPSVIERTVKGGPDAFCIELLDAYRDIIREQLMDGLLAARGVIDRRAVERSLSNLGPPRNNDYLRLLALADAEAWVRHWSIGAAPADGRLSGPDAAVRSEESAGRSSHSAASGTT
ncbi:asparagine synthase-related protein [Sphingobium fuliginis]|jgi:asparagine synthase (glutamine-hydrolysing)|uniref:asparagine synthase-related protein n=1 Tax=Sphingobium fuliginis (strain ATCC 27551) TaxID=336203 RepID=UPI0030844DDF